ncbi:hypothetical protein [Cellulomonas sp. URHD0024]|uniref:hypothetical protein n=1 Tax=Cellulomonas sp. URHD0024 TaxID=1302620 RepID=UPI000406A56D|nr:hypothetical protein [Cellulomonas sp. URHD0024]
MKARAVVALNGWCLLILTVINLPLVAWLAGFYLLLVVICALAVYVVGLPAGLVLARLLRNIADERVHVAVFALTGACLSVGLCVALGVEFWSSRAWLILPVAAAEGVLGAGGARWWSGRPARRVTPAELPAVIQA